MFMWGCHVTWNECNILSLAGCTRTKACNGVAMSVAMMAAVAAMVPVVLAVVGASINMASTMATVIHGGNHLDRWSICTVPSRVFGKYWRHVPYTI